MSDGVSICVDQGPFAIWISRMDKIRNVILRVRLTKSLTTCEMCPCATTDCAAPSSSTVLCCHLCSPPQNSVSCICRSTARSVSWFHLIMGNIRKLLSTFTIIDYVAEILRRRFGKIFIGSTFCADTG